MHARVVELADTLGSGSSGSNLVGVQVPSLAPEVLTSHNFELFTAV